MTEKEIVYNILNTHSGGRLSDDFIPSYNQVAFMVKYVRAMLIRRDANEIWDINPDYYQDLGCIKLIKVDKAECCEIDLDCDILRTEIKLPKPIRLKTKVAIIVNAVDKQTTLDVILPQRSLYIKYSKYTAAIPRVYYLNGYIYVPNTLELTYLNVRAIIENPEEANSFLCDGEACYTADSNYPLPADMVQPLTELILSKEMNYMLKTAPDENNNSQPNGNLR
jgi:hypothetical protein